MTTTNDPVPDWLKRLRDNAYIAIADLPKGPHRLEVNILQETFYYDRPSLIIPFIKE